MTNSNNYQSKFINFLLLEENKPISQKIKFAQNFQLKKNLSLIQSKTKDRDLLMVLSELFQDNLLYNTPLAISKLSFVAASAHSMAFQDENQHIVKIGFLRLNHEKEELSFYNHFLDHPTKNFVIHYLKKFVGYPFFIVVTNKMTTFKDYLSFIIPKESQKISWTKVSDFKPQFLISFIEEIDSIPETNPSLILSELKNSGILKLFLENMQNQYQIPEKYAEQICYQIIAIVSRNGVDSDVHLGNLGVNITKGFDNPSFFFFDR